jgi:hypothetical protein
VHLCCVGYLCWRPAQGGLPRRTRLRTHSKQLTI